MCGIEQKVIATILQATVTLCYELKIGYRFIQKKCRNII